MWPLIILLLANLASAAVICPDGNTCPDQSTCCKLQAGNYACCPLEKDGFSILTESKIFTMETEALSTSVSSDSSVIYCDNVYYCQNGYTCCKLNSGGWSCCPHPATICCFGGTKCCPKDHTGDSSPSSGPLKDLSIPVESKIFTMETEALSTSVSSDSSVIYCDNVYHCPNGYTCCRLNSGGWSCCPHPATICCFGGTKCCPKDHTGDSSPSSGPLKDLSIPVESKIFTMETEALSTSVSSDSSVIYCDNVYHCPNGYTCCRLNSGGWSCCPHPATICCFGGTKCCPKDHTGDSSPSSGPLKDLSIPVESKIFTMETEALSTSVSSDSSVIYCDNVYHCPNGYTCCRLNSGGWSCCPHPATVCCYGGTKCCPKDYTGDSSPSSAPLKDLSIPVESKIFTMETEALSTSVSSDSSVIYCDNVYYCQNGYTCCKLNSGAWSCCPHPAAVCCKDGIHCCPHGTKCDIQRSMCKMDSVSIPWLIKNPALIGSDTLQNSLSSDVSVVHCDDTHVCKAGSTCCKMYHKEWGCCPIPNAHCCLDGLHCCPKYHFCYMRKHLCIRIFASYNWIQLSSVKNAEESENF
ncbi:progranulin-like [Heptranchias perlo]|uniref:progranulin-like n=1 Tax=Heptranchias perlo TaxID=212740 RepID=UPI00355A9C2A